MADGKNAAFQTVKRVVEQFQDMNPLEVSVLGSNLSPTWRIIPLSKVMDFGQFGKGSHNPILRGPTNHGY